MMRSTFEEIKGAPFLVFAAALAYLVSALGFFMLASDIQLAIAFIGLFSGTILVGQAAILSKLS